MSNLLFLADDLSVSLGENRILSGVGFTVEAGTWVGLLGPNGSGKTTLLRTLAGLLPYDGVLQFKGEALAAWPSSRLARHVAFLQQTSSLAFDFTVEEMVLMGRMPHQGWLAATTRQDLQRTQAALAGVDLEGFEHRKMPSLSGGEQQRVLLARAMVQEAEVLLLDEPTNHLDVHHQFALMQTVRALVDQGRTVITAFHDLEMAARHADAWLVLDQGRAAAYGPPAAVLRPELLRSVFRMEAEVMWDNHGYPQIHFLAPC